MSLLYNHRNWLISIVSSESGSHSNAISLDYTTGSRHNQCYNSINYNCQKIVLWWKLWSVVHCCTPPPTIIINRISIVKWGLGVGVSVLLVLSNPLHAEPNLYRLTRWEVADLQNMLSNWSWSETEGRLPGYQPGGRRTDNREHVGNIDRKAVRSVLDWIHGKLRLCLIQLIQTV